MVVSLVPAADGGACSTGSKDNLHSDSQRIRVLPIEMKSVQNE